MTKNHFTLLCIFAFIAISSTIDLDSLYPYQDLTVPEYIERDNTPNDNPISDIGATLGRVLFYDKQLSLDGSVACASCHKQEFAFGDDLVQSEGLNGMTGRHSMRLVNARFSDEVRFFWDERAEDLEAQSTQPIQDHIEMGFSGEEGDPGIDSVLDRLETIDYYQILFPEAFGDSEITEERMQLALAQFVRSIQSFDTRFDDGFVQVNNVGQPFPNYTDEENLGKQLFLLPPNVGGAGCAGCHNPPEFSIDPNSLNNGVIGVAGEPDAIDLTNTKAPSLRELVNDQGVENGPFMHDGSLNTLMDVIEHYNQIDIDPLNANLDPRLTGGPGGQGQNLDLTDDEKSALEAFLYTLSGEDVYSAVQWSDPFDENGDLEIIGGSVSVDFQKGDNYEVQAYPNPCTNLITVTSELDNGTLRIYGLNGALYKELPFTGQSNIDVSLLSTGTYILELTQDENRKVVKVVKH